MAYDPTKYINDLGLKKCSPSSIMNYYYPMEAKIDQIILERAGKRGTALHELVELTIAKESINFEKITKELEPDCFLKVGKIFKNFENNYKEFFKENDIMIGEEFKQEEFISQLEDLCGYIDYFDNNKIIDWKSNSVLTKKDITKYSLQMNLYRYMIFKTKGILIDDLYLIHLCKRYQKNGDKSLIKLNLHKCELIDFKELETKISVVYSAINVDKLDIENLF